MEKEKITETTTVAKATPTQTEQEKKVENKTTTTAAPPQVTPQPVPAQPQPKPRKRNGAFAFWFISLLVIGGAFTVFGIFLQRTVIPSVETWLRDHNFIEGNRSIEQNSPFIPKTTDVPNSGTKGGTTYTIPDVVKKVSPGVVSIAISGSSSLQNGAANNIGTGFIIDAAGVIVTNQHVVSNTSSQYEVVTQDNKTYKAQKIIRDDINDIALIIINASNLSTVSLGNSDSIQVGETVIAIGTPLGEYPGSVTVGVISGVGRSVTTSGSFWESGKVYENVIQTDAAVNPGNSGGPLLNLAGEVIGVNFATTGGADNISFALPINLIKQKLTEYKQYGKFRNAYLGVSYRMVTEQEAQYYNVEVGALVQTVATGSPAEKAKLQVGDIITKINDAPVQTSLVSLLSKYKVGDEITLSVYRTVKNAKPEQLTVKVVLSDRPS